MNASPVVLAAPVPRRSWRRRLILLALAALLLLVALAPSIISWSPRLRDAVLRRLVGDIRGTVAVDSLSLGWFQPIVVTRFRLEPVAGGAGPGSSAGEALVTVDRLESDRPLWRMLWRSDDIGTLRVERPVVFVKLTDRGSNFQEVFEPVLKKEAKLPATLRFGARVRIVDGKLHGRSLERGEPWEITGINIGVGVRSESATPHGRAELFVEKGTLVARQPLAVGLCNDVLKYVAPVLADVASTSGNITIELDDWRLPWNDFASGELGGRLTMHTVDVGPGPVVQTVVRQINALPIVGDAYRKLGLPETVQIARESTVPFRMIDGGRIHHENLRFSVADLVDVQSHGTVGFDETLDMTTALGIHPPRADERRLALLRVLTSQPWPVNIRGSLGKPELDLSPLNDAWKQLVFEKLPQDWQSGRGSLGEDALRALSEHTGLPVDPETVGPLLQMLRPLLDQAQPRPSPNADGAPQTTPGSMPREIVAPAGAPTPGRATGERRQPPPPQPAPPAAAPSATGPSTAEAIVDGVGTALDVLEALRARRQAQMQNRPAPPAAPAASPEAVPSAPPPRRPLLRQGLRMLLEPPPPQPPAPSPTATAPPPRPK